MIFYQNSTKLIRLKLLLFFINDFLACNCDLDGTEDHSGENCDAITGQCQCLPNVVGKQCDSCKVDYYGLKSREGCSYCNCEVEGTHNNKTNCDFVIH